MPLRRFYMQNYNTLSAYWKQKFGTRVWKIPLDAGLDCPNRDGTISVKGCIFCNELGSGTGLDLNCLSLKDQYNLFRDKLLSRHGSIKFAAYLQSFSNTHCSPEKLESILSQLKDLQDLKVLCVGTRPDCLDEEKVRILATFPCDEIWLDLGLQSSCDETLTLINRGHLAQDFSRSCALAASKKILVCAHVIAGLPGETRVHFLQTIDFVNNEPVQGIKFHNLYICKNTTLARWWQSGRYLPQDINDYALWTASAISRLRPDIIIHRLTGDPAPGELLAPRWASGKNSILNSIQRVMTEKNLWQGKQWINPSRL